MCFEQVLFFCRKKGSKNNTWNEEKGPNTRSIPGLQETCKATGGLFIESSKVDVSDIMALLSKSIESSKVSNRGWYCINQFNSTYYSAFLVFLG